MNPVRLYSRLRYVSFTHWVEHSAADAAPQGCECTVERLRGETLYLVTGRPALSHQNTLDCGGVVYLNMAACPCGAQYSVLLEANAVTGPRPAECGTGSVKLSLRMFFHRSPVVEVNTSWAEPTEKINITVYKINTTFSLHDTNEFMCHSSNGHIALGGVHVPGSWP